MKYVVAARIHYVTLRGIRASPCVKFLIYSCSKYISARDVVPVKGTRFMASWPYSECYFKWKLLHRKY